MPLYHCPQCNLDSTSLSCPGCRQFLSNDITEIEATMADYPAPKSGVIECGSAIGAWGDTIVALGNLVHVLKLCGQKSCDILHYGPDGSIAEFLQAQSFIRRVYHVQPTPSEYQEVNYLSSVDRDWLSVLKQSHKDLPDSLYSTHVNYAHMMHRRVHPWKGAKLPVGHIQWAKKQRASVKSSDRVFLLHPLSEQSESSRHHWPHWEEAIRWMLAETPHSFILTGLRSQLPSGLLAHPRIVNIVGQTDSNCQILALAQTCDGIISTCNSLSHWSVVTNTPALITGNLSCMNAANSFRRFYDRRPNTCLLWNSPFNEFIDIASKWLADPAHYEAPKKRNPYMVNDPTEEPAVKVRCLKIIAGRNGIDHPKGSVVSSHEIAGDYRTLIGWGAAEIEEGDATKDSDGGTPDGPKAPNVNPQKAVTDPAPTAPNGAPIKTTV